MSTPRRTPVLLATLLSATLLLSTTPSHSADLKTEATFAAAQARAKTENRLLLLVFKAYYCGHCQEFTEKVLDTAIFRAFAAQHLVVVIYDIADPAKLPEAERKVAKQLEEKFKVESTPTMVVFDPQGKQLLRTEGYAGSPAEKIVAHLDNLRATKP